MSSGDVFQETANSIVQSSLIKATRDMAAFANRNPLDKLCADVQRDAALYACLLLPTMIMHAVQQSDICLQISCTSDEKDIFDSLPQITLQLGRMLHEEAPIMVVEPPVISRKPHQASPVQSFVSSIFEGVRSYWHAQAGCMEDVLEGRDEPANLAIYTNAMLSATPVMDLFRKHAERDVLLLGTGVNGDALDIDHFRMAGIWHGANAVLQKMKISGQ